MNDYSMPEYADKFERLSTEISMLQERVEEIKNSLKNNADESIFNRIITEDAVEHLSKSKAILQQYADNIRELNEMYDAVEIDVAAQFKF